MQTLIETTQDGVEVHVPFDLGFGAKGADGGPNPQMFDLSLDERPISIMRGPRERAIDDGVKALSDSDLLAIVLGTGLTGCPVTQLSYALIARFGGLEGMARLGPEAIAEHPGMGTVKALRVAAALEAGRRSLMNSLRPKMEIITSVAVAEWFTSRLGWKEREELWSLSLDGRNRMRSARRIAQGGIHGIHLTARDVLTAGLQDAASAVILVHNHPSGDPMPSLEDVEMTHRVAAAGRAIGLPLIDHVIVSNAGRYASMLDLGMMPSNS